MRRKKKATETHAVLLLWSLRKEAKREQCLKEHAVEWLGAHGGERLAGHIQEHFGLAEARYQEFKSWCERWLSPEGLETTGLTPPDDTSL